MCSSALCSLLATSSLQRNCHFRPLLGWKGMALSEEVWDSCITSIPTRVWLRATHDLWWCFPASSEGPQGSHDPGAFFNPLASRGSITSLLVLSFPHSTSQPCTTGPEKTTHQVSLPLGPCVSTGKSHALGPDEFQASRLLPAQAPLLALPPQQLQSLWVPMQVSDPVPVSPTVGNTLQSHPVGLMEAPAGSRN